MPIGREEVEVKEDLLEEVLVELSQEKGAFL